ncbi:unnamed protein product [Hymenolepis diminuta]|uniref:Uncharacterized protein n=1 Tax=Hymenolepis diminuta TaxID=6216 RepID=A0A564Y0C3_HYMDI|nr:unnamed protein product [Hymenolepis diminuta]
MTTISNRDMELHVMWRRMWEVEHMGFAMSTEVMTSSSAEFKNILSLDSYTFAELMVGDNECDVTSFSFYNSDNFPFC